MTSKVTINRLATGVPGLAEVQAFNPALVFVDSFRSVVLASKAEGDPNVNPHNASQQFVQQLGMHMTRWQATRFLIGEYFTDTDPNPIFTVADGLIWLRQSVQRNSMVRRLEIMKMRGEFTTDDAGIPVGERLVGQQGLLGGRPMLTLNGPDGERDVAGVRAT